MLYAFAQKGDNKFNDFGVKYDYYMFPQPGDNGASTNDPGAAINGPQAQRVFEAVAVNGA